MSMSNKCEICGWESDHNYKHQELCKYHYWIAKGRPKDERWVYIWKDYRYLHPVRVSRWRKMDPDFDKFLEVK